MGNVRKMRKRSSIVGFTAVGLVGILSACGQEESAPVAAQPKGETHKAYSFKSVAQCQREGVFSKEKCKEGYDAALKEQQSSKDFSRKEECEAEYGEGKCETRRGGGFGGAMLGYLIGRSMSGSQYSYSGLYNDRKTGGLVSGPNGVMTNGKAQAYAMSANTFDKQTSGAEKKSREKSRMALASRGGFGGHSGDVDGSSHSSHRSLGG